jgi:hypothetical protein
LDIAEEISYIPCDMIVANSEFTRKTFKECFRLLNYLKIDPLVFYPALDFKKFEIS